MPVDDYYSLIGVAADADRDEIKDAYRARRAELDESETSRANAALLNRAWNVLSDAQQRERYDDQLATARADDDVIVPEIVASASSNGSGNRSAAKSKSQQRRDAARSSKSTDRKGRLPLVQESEVNGVPLAATRERVYALAIDAFICILILVFGTALVSSKVADSQKPQVVANVDQLTKDAKSLSKEYDLAKTKASSASDTLAAAKKANDTFKISTSEAAKKIADGNAATAKKNLDDKNKAVTKEDGKLSTIRLFVFLGGIALCFVILAIPTMLTGRSPGKAIRGLRLVAEDGSKATPAKVSVHYGAVLGFIGSMGAVLGPIAMALALFGVSSFNRNPKRQGWHDRIAKTRVVHG